MSVVIKQNPQIMSDTKRKDAEQIVALSVEDLVSLVEAATQAAGPGFATGKEMYARLARSGAPLEVTTRGLAPRSQSRLSIKDALSARPAAGAEGWERMLIPGPVETFQIVDRSADLPVMQHLAVTEDVIAFAAPALAAVADAYAGESEAERFRLNNRLDELLRDCADTTAPGLGEAAPYYLMLPFSQGAVHSFAKIRQVLGEDDIFSTQTYAIAHSEDVPLLLIRTATAQAHMGTLYDAGIDIHVSWIDTSTEGA